METVFENRPLTGVGMIQEKINRIAPLLRENIDEEEKRGRLSRQVIGALRECGLHKLYMPEILGGLEADPLTVALLVEEISKYNAAAGWSMMVANVSTWWCRGLPEKGIEELYLDGSDTMLAGALHPPMSATRVPGGFQINGRTPLASNVHEAKWIFVSALLMEDNQVKMNNGIPTVIGVFMDAKKCRILDTWHAIGMKATDSNDVEANEVFVPDHRSFPLKPEPEPNNYYQGVLYRFSAIGIGVASLIAPVALAVATNAINEFKILAEKKTSFGSVSPLRERGVVQRKLGQAEALVQSSRAYLHNTLASCWEKTMRRDKLSLTDKADLLLAATHTNQSCLQAVDLMYSAAGSSAMYTQNKLSRYFSDMQIIRQHGFVNDSRYETAAQVYLDLKPDLPVLAF